MTGGAAMEAAQPPQLAEAYARESAKPPDQRAALVEFDYGRHAALEEDPCADCACAPPPRCEPDPPENARRRNAGASLTRACGFWRVHRHAAAAASAARNLFVED